MPSYKSSPQTNLIPDVPISPVQEREGEYKHNIVRSEELNHDAVISHVEGSSWYVDYYSQVLSLNMEPKHYDINQSPVNQQYHLIKSIEFKLQNQDTSTDDKTNIVRLSGTAAIYAGVIPNVGDVIIADIGSAMAGRMTVMRVDKKSYFKDTVYEIDFELIEYINTKDKEDHLNSFVVKTSVFVKDLITYGSDPVILEEEYFNLKNADNVARELIDDFLKEFFSNELSTFQVPGYGRQATYDPYVVEAFREVVGLTEHPLMYRLKALNVNEIKEAYSFSIWPVLITPQLNKIKNIWKKAGPVSYQEFHLNPVMNSFRYSGFAQCISPVEDLQNVDYYQGWAQQSKRGSLMTMNMMTSVLAGSYGTAIGKQLAEAIKDQDKVCCHHLVWYHQANPKALPLNSSTWLDTVHLWVRATGHYSCCSVCGGCDECCACDGCEPEDGCPKDDPYDYVLPNKFWTGKLDDPFSSLIRRYLNGDKITYTELIKLIEDRMSLTPKDRFYKMMVYLIILKSTMRSN